jgi:flagellar motor switch protein FliG
MYRSNIFNISNLKDILKDVKSYNFENYLLNFKKLNNNILKKCVEIRRERYKINNIPYNDFNYLKNLLKKIENNKSIINYQINK